MSKLQNLLALPLALLLCFSTFSVTVVQAKMVGTDEIISAQQLSAEREKIIAFIERDDVRAEMQSLGVDPQEARQRVASLSDSEVGRLAGNLDQLPAGEGAGAIVGAIVLVFLVLLLTDILCLTSIFEFTRCAR